MNPIALELLEKEPVCVLSVVLADGFPHGAVVHFSQLNDPVKLFIQTSETVKTQAIEQTGGTAKASVAVGFSEQEFVTLQMRGMVRIVTDQSELEAIYPIHYGKHPKAEKHKGPHTIFLEFIPTWWRYTDLKTSPRTILTN